MSAYGLDAAVATTFEVVEGRFTGKVAGMALAHHKLTRVREWADREGVDLADCWFYTDSVTDRALMEAVGHPVAVNPDRPLRALAAEKGWPVVDWGMSGPKGSLTG
jgi:phosphoserine phosphatase